MNDDRPEVVNLKTELTRGLLSLDGPSAELIGRARNELLYMFGAMTADGQELDEASDEEVAEAARSVVLHASNLRQIIRDVFDRHDLNQPTH